MMNYPDPTVDEKAYRAAVISRYEGAKKAHPPQKLPLIFVAPEQSDDSLYFLSVSSTEIPEKYVAEKTVQLFSTPNIPHACLNWVYKGPTAAKISDYYYPPTVLDGLCDEELKDDLTQQGFVNNEFGTWSFKEIQWVRYDKIIEQIEEKKSLDYHQGFRVVLFHGDVEKGGACHVQEQWGDGTFLSKCGSPLYGGGVTPVYRVINPNHPLLIAGENVPQKVGKAGYGYDYGKVTAAFLCPVEESMPAPSFRFQSTMLGKIPVSGEPNPSKDVYDKRLAELKNQVDTMAPIWQPRLFAAKARQEAMFAAGCMKFQDLQREDIDPNALKAIPQLERAPRPPRSMADYDDYDSDREDSSPLLRVGFSHS